MKKAFQKTYKPKQKDTKTCPTEWQEYARNVVEEFGYIKPYDKIVWKYAKKNLSYLKGKVESLRESQDDLSKCGRLLTYKLTKNK